MRNAAFKASSQALTRPGMAELSQSPAPKIQRRPGQEGTIRP